MQNKNKICFLCCCFFSFISFSSINNNTYNNNTIFFLFIFRVTTPTLCISLGRTYIFIYIICIFSLCIFFSIFFTHFFSFFSPFHFLSTLCLILLAQNFGAQSVKLLLLGRSKCPIDIRCRSYTHTRPPMPSL